MCDHVALIDLHMHLGGLNFRLVCIIAAPFGCGTSNFKQEHYLDHFQTLPTAVTNLASHLTFQ